MYVSGILPKCFNRSYLILFLKNIIYTEKYKKIFFIFIKKYFLSIKYKNKILYIDIFINLNELFLLTIFLFKT